MHSYSSLPGDIPPRMHRAFKVVREIYLRLGVQDTAAVLEDVRKIIAEQLGTDQDKVSCSTLSH